MKNDNEGITLTALVVTVIILLILAGITLNMTILENEIIAKAKQAKENTIQVARRRSRRVKYIVSRVNI